MDAKIKELYQQRYEVEVREANAKKEREAITRLMVERVVDMHATTAMGVESVEAMQEVMMKLLSDVRYLTDY